VQSEVSELPAIDATDTPAGGVLGSQKAMGSSLSVSTYAGSRGFLTVGNVSIIFAGTSISAVKGA
jgi:hypothetical protein